MSAPTNDSFACDLVECSRNPLTSLGADFIEANVEEARGVFDRVPSTRILLETHGRHTAPLSALRSRGTCDDPYK